MLNFTFWSVSAGAAWFLQTTMKQKPLFSHSKDESTQVSWLKKKHVFIRFERILVSDYN